MSQNLNALVAALETINKKDLELSVTETEQIFKKGVVEYVSQQNALVASIRRVSTKDVLTYADRYITSKLDSDDPRDIFFNAAREVTNFVEYAISGPTLNRAMVVEYRDLLPVSHPFSTKPFAPITASARRVRNAVWVANDPRITDESARKVVFEVFSSPTGGTKKMYAAARLEALTASLVPTDIRLEALTAAFGIGNPFAGNNSSAARSARAKLQRRDRKGRFAEMGGGSRILALIGDMVKSFTGKFAGNPQNSNKVEVELPGSADLPAGIYSVPASKVEGLKAILRTGEAPAMKATSQNSKAAISLQELLASRKTAPTGWTDNGDGTFTSADGYSVSTLPSGQQAPSGSKFVGAGPDGSFSSDAPLFELRDDNNNVVGYAQEWANLQKLAADADEAKGKSPIAKARLKRDVKAGFAQKPGEESRYNYDTPEGMLDYHINENGFKETTTDADKESGRRRFEANGDVFQEITIEPDGKVYLQGTNAYTDRKGEYQEDDIDEVYDPEKLGGGEEGKAQAIDEAFSLANYHKDVNGYEEPERDDSRGFFQKPGEEPKDLDTVDGVVKAYGPDFKETTTDADKAAGKRTWFYQGDAGSADITQNADGTVEVSGVYFGADQWGNEKDYEFDDVFNPDNYGEGEEARATAIDDAFGTVEYKVNDRGEPDYDEETGAFFQKPGEEPTPETVDDFIKQYGKGFKETTTDAEKAAGKRTWFYEGDAGSAEVTQNEDGTVDISGSYVTAGPFDGRDVEFDDTFTPDYYGEGEEGKIGALDDAFAQVKYQVNDRGEPDYEPDDAEGFSQKPGEGGGEYKLSNDFFKDSNWSNEPFKDREWTSADGRVKVAYVEDADAGYYPDDRPVNTSYLEITVDGEKLEDTVPAPNATRFEGDGPGIPNEVMELDDYAGDVEALINNHLASKGGYKKNSSEILDDYFAELEKAEINFEDPGANNYFKSKDGRLEISEGDDSWDIKYDGKDLPSVRKTYEDEDYNERLSTTDDIYDGLFSSLADHLREGETTEDILRDVKVSGESMLNWLKSRGKRTNETDEQFNSRISKAENALNDLVAALSEGNASKIKNFDLGSFGYNDNSEQGRALGNLKNIAYEAKRRFERRSEGFQQSAGRQRNENNFRELKTYAGEIAADRKKFSDAIFSDGWVSKDGKLSVSWDKDDDVYRVSLNGKDVGFVYGSVREYNEKRDRVEDTYQERDGDEVVNALYEMVNGTFKPGTYDDNGQYEYPFYYGEEGFQQSAGAAGGVDPSHIANLKNWDGDPSDGNDATYTSPNGRLEISSQADAEPATQDSLGRNLSRNVVYFDDEYVGELPYLSPTYNESDLADDVSKLVEDHLNKRTGGFNQRPGKVGNFLVVDPAIVKRESRDVFGSAETSDGGIVRLENNYDGTMTPVAYNRSGEIMGQGTKTDNIDDAVADGERLLADLEGNAFNKPDQAGFAQRAGDEPPAWTNDPASPLQYRKLQGILDNQADKLPTDVRDMVEEAVANKALTKGEMGKLIAEVGKTADLSISYTPKIDKASAVNPARWNRDGSEFTSEDGRLKVTREGDFDRNILSVTYDGKPVDIAPDYEQEILNAMGDIEGSQFGPIDANAARQKAVDAIDIALKDAAEFENKGGFAQRPGRELTPKPDRDLDSFTPTENGGMVTRGVSGADIEVSPDVDGTWTVYHAYNYMPDEGRFEESMDEGSKTFPTKEEAEAFANKKLEYYNSTQVDEDAYEIESEKRYDVGGSGERYTTEDRNIGGYGFNQKPGNKVSPEVSAKNNELAERLLVKGAFGRDGGLDENDPDYEALQDIKDRNEAYLSDLAETDPAQYFYEIAKAAEAMDAEPSQFRLMIEKPWRYHSEVLDAQINDWVMDGKPGTYLDEIGYGSDEEGFAQKAGTKKVDPEAAIQKIIDAAPKDRGFAQRAGEEEGLNSNGKIAGDIYDPETYGMMDWASKWADFSVAERENRLGEWWKWQEEFAQWLVSEDPEEAARQGLVDVYTLRDILDGNVGTFDPLSKRDNGWRDLGNGTYEFRSETINIFPVRNDDGITFDYNITNAGTDELIDTIQNVGEADSVENLISGEFRSDLEDIGYEVSGGSSNAGNLFPDPYRRNRGFAQKAGSDSGLLEEDPAAIKLGGSFSDTGSGGMTYQDADGRTRGSVQMFFTKDKNGKESYGWRVEYLPSNGEPMVRKQFMQKYDGAYEGKPWLAAEKYLRGLIAKDNASKNKEKTGGFSAKQMEPATPAQYALLQEYADERVPADDLTAQAIQEALANRNLTKAQMSALIGPMRDAAFKPGVDPNKPSDRALQSLNNKLVSKDLTPEEVKDILDRLPSMNRAEVDDLNDKLRSKKDRPETIGFSQEPGGDNEEQNMRDRAGEEIRSGTSADEASELDAYYNSLKGDRVSELQQRINAADEEIGLFGLDDLQEMLDEADPDNPANNKMGRTWPVEQSYIAAEDLRDAAEKIRNSNNPNIDKGLATELDNAADQVMKRMEDKVNPLISASVAEAYGDNFDLGDVDTDLDQMRELYFETDTDNIKQYLDQTGVYGDVRSGGAEAVVSDEPEEDGENKGKYRAFVSYGGGTADSDQVEYFDDEEEAKNWAALEVSELNRYHQVDLTHPDKSFSDLDAERNEAIADGTEQEFLKRLSDVAKMMRNQRGDEKLSWKLDDYVERAQAALDRKNRNSESQGFAQRGGRGEGDYEVARNLQRRGQRIIDEYKDDGKLYDDETDEEFEERIQQAQDQLDGLIFELDYGTGDSLERFGMRFDNENEFTDKLDALTTEARYRRSAAMYGGYDPYFIPVSSDDLKEDADGNLSLSAQGRGGNSIEATLEKNKKGGYDLFMETSGEDSDNSFIEDFISPEDASDPDNFQDAKDSAAEEIEKFANPNYGADEDQYRGGRGFAQKAGNAVVSPKMGEPATDAQYDYLKELGDTQDGISPDLATAIQDALQGKNLTKAQMGALLGQLRALKPKAGIDTSKPTPRQLKRVKDLANSLGLSPSEKRKLGITNLSSKSADEIQQLIDNLKRRGAGSPKA